MSLIIGSLFGSGIRNPRNLFLYSATSLGLKEIATQERRKIKFLGIFPLPKKRDIQQQHSKRPEGRRHTNKAKKWAFDPRLPRLSFQVFEIQILAGSRIGRGRRSWSRIEPRPVLAAKANRAHLSAYATARGQSGPE